MMFNFTLYKHGIKGNLKTLLIFAAVMAVYVSLIITMYDQKLMKMLDDYVIAMPEIMATVGMTAGATTLLGFMSSYLYGFVLMIFPMVFSILCANKLISRHVDKGSMIYLLAAPVKRRVVAFTQMKVLATGIFALILLATALEICISEASFPGELDINRVLILNLGLLGLHLFIGGICFLCSCTFSDSKFSIGFGAGIPSLAFVIQMMVNMGGRLENAKYATFFTLFNPYGIINNNVSAIAGIVALFLGAALLFITAIVIFSKKDLMI